MRANLIMHDCCVHTFFHHKYEFWKNMQHIFGIELKRINVYVVSSLENILLHNDVIYGKLSFTKNCAEYQLYRLSKSYPIIVCARVCNMQENFLYLPRCLSILALKRKYLLPACLLYSYQSNTNCNDIGNTKTVVIFQSL